MVNCKNAIICLVPKPRDASQGSILERIRAQRTQEAGRQRSEFDVLIRTPAGRCVVSFDWKDELDHFYAAVQAAVTGTAAYLDVQAAGLLYKDVKVKHFKITGDVCIENVVTMQAEESLPCHLTDEATIRVTTDEDPLQVRVVNDSDDPVPIQDTH